MLSSSYGIDASTLSQLAHSNDTEPPVPLFTSPAPHFIRNDLMLPSDPPTFLAASSALPSSNEIQPLLSHLSGFFTDSFAPDEQNVPVRWDDLDFSWLLNETSEQSGELPPRTVLPDIPAKVAQDDPPGARCTLDNSTADEHLWVS